MRIILLLVLASVTTASLMDGSSNDDAPSILELIDIKLLDNSQSGKSKLQKYAYESKQENQMKKNNVVAQNSILKHTPKLFNRWNRFSQLQTDTCYATPFFYGPNCESNQGLVGSPGKAVLYTVSPAETMVEPQVCCKGLSYTGITGSWVNIGCGSDQSDIVGSVPWGAIAGKPAISCTASPTGSAVSWTWA